MQEKFYGRPVLIADRTCVEQKSDVILHGAEKADVALLVVGDPLAATTHHDLMMRASDAGIPVNVVHNASIMNAVACCGLQLYSFGQTYVGNESDSQLSFALQLAISSLTHISTS